MSLGDGDIPEKDTSYISDNIAATALLRWSTCGPSDCWDLAGRACITSV